MKNLIRHILKESNKSKFIDLVISKIKSNNFKPPYFKKLRDFELSDKDIKLILSKVLGKHVKADPHTYDSVYDDSGNLIYYEKSDGYWEKWERNEKGKIVFYTTVNNYWEKNKYDESGNEIYHEDSGGYWIKRWYDEKGNFIYFEDSDGNWNRMEYNEIGHLIYRENAKGVILDRR